MLLFWGFFWEIIIFALILCILGWIAMVIIFKASGTTLAEQDETEKIV